MKLIHNRQELEQALILMHQEGRPIRELSREFHLGRNTIRRILRAHGHRREVGHDLLTKRLTRASKLDPFVPQMKQLLDKYPRITGVRIYEELKEAAYSGGISILREWLQKRRPTGREPVIRFETDPGRQGQMDWSPYTIPFTRSGKSPVQCFSYILAFSRRQYIDFTTSHDFYSLIRRHQDAFQYFGGVPRECLYDNEKTVVLQSPGATNSGSRHSESPRRRRWSDRCGWRSSGRDARRRQRRRRRSGPCRARCRPGSTGHGRAGQGR
jgi:transposase